MRQAEMTSADLHDSQRGEAMIQGDEAAYYADKAYDSQALRDKLGELGIEDRIAYKAKRNQPDKRLEVYMSSVIVTERAAEAIAERYRHFSAAAPVGKSIPVLLWSTRSHFDDNEGNRTEWVQYSIFTGQTREKLGNTTTSQSTLRMLANSHWRRASSSKPGHIRSKHRTAP